MLSRSNSRYEINLTANWWTARGVPQTLARGVFRVAKNKLYAVKQYRKVAGLTSPQTADPRHDESHVAKFAAASLWDAAGSRANIEFQARHRDRPREPDSGQSVPRSVPSSLWHKRIVQHNPKCNPVQHPNQQLARQAFADRCDATVASSFGKHLRSEALTRSF
jgi:hypothetical protein